MKLDRRQALLGTFAVGLALLFGMNEGEAVGRSYM